MRILWPVKLLLGISRDATTVWRSSLFAVRLVALVMASVAFSGVLWVTEPAGPGYQAASAAYLSAAQSLASGQGYRVPTADWASPDSISPLTRYPPGYPTALSVPVRMGFPPAQAARLVEAVSAFVAMAALLAVVGDSVGPVAAALLGLALLAMPMMVDLHLSVLSEPLFVACVALTFALMVAAPDAVFAAGLCAALAVSVRYAGIAVVGALVAWTLLRSGSWQQRTRRAATAALPGALVAGTWMWIVHRALAGGAVVAGPASAIGAGGPAVNDGVGAAVAGAAATIGRWLVPTANGAVWARWVAVPAAAALAALVAVGARRAYRLWRLLPKDMALTSSTNVPQLLAARVLGASAVFAATYSAVLIGAVVFTDRSVSVGDRMLAPVLLLGSAGIAVAIASWWRSAGRPWRAAVVAALVLWGTASFRVSRAHAHEALTYGFDFANDVWRRSQLLEWVRNDGNQRDVYSNWPAAVYLHVGRAARGLPADGADAATLRAFADTLRSRDGGRGVVLEFRALNPAYVSADSLIAQAGLQVLATYPDGRVLGAPQP